MRQAKERPTICASCGGALEQKDLYTCKCTSCGRTYYISANRAHKISVRLSAGKTILLCALAAMAAAGGAVAGYQHYTGRLVKSASRFCVAFRDFLMEVYGKPIAEIGQEDLSRIKYLKIEKDKKGYRFTCGFEDYYDYRDPNVYEETLRAVTVEAAKDDFSPTNVQYFTGLTRLELYTDAWENYVLPEENALRSIWCVDGLSRYGTPQFFSRVNPKTLEEVAIMEAEKLEDFSFMEHLKGVKSLMLHGAALKDGEMFRDFDNLETLVLYQVEMKEDRASEIVEGLLSLPSLKYFRMEGKAAWYLDEEQWQQWQRLYEGKIVLSRE